jgi:hypothetical protein
VAAFSNQVNDGPVVFAALDVVQCQIDDFSSAESTPKKHCQDSSIPFPFDGVHIGKLPQGAAFLHSQPIPKPHAQLFRSLHSADACSQIWAQESRVCGLVGEPSDSRQAYIDGSRSEEPIFKVDSVTRDYGLIERQARLRAIPGNKVIN